jgi:hypothetical protein
VEILRHGIREQPATHFVHCTLRRGITVGVLADAYEAADGNMANAGDLELLHCTFNGVSFRVEQSCARGDADFSNVFGH